MTFEVDAIYLIEKQHLHRARYLVRVVAIHPPTLVVDVFTDNGIFYRATAWIPDLQNENYYRTTQVPAKCWLVAQLMGEWDGQLQL